MKFLAIKSYWKHQHYHKRGAPWIKLHASVLADAAFIQLPEVAQAQLMKLWSLASQLGHPLPNNPRLLAGKIGTTGKFHLPALIAAGFIVPCNSEDDAGRIAKERTNERNASISLGESTRPSREIEEEIERTLPPQSAAEAELEAGIAAMLDNDADRNALTIVVSRANSRMSCLRALHAALTGNDPSIPQPSPTVFGQALRDMVTNDQPPTARKIRNYIEGARPMASNRSPPSGAARTGSTSRRDTKVSTGPAAPPTDSADGIKWQT